MATPGGIASSPPAAQDVMEEPCDAADAETSRGHGPTRWPHTPEPILKLIAGARVSARALTEPSQSAFVEESSHRGLLYGFNQMAHLTGIYFDRNYRSEQ